MHLEPQEPRGGGVYGTGKCCGGHGGQALSAPLSLRSVLDDEGSNLRQQKLERQVSEAAAWRVAVWAGL